MHPELIYVKDDVENYNIYLGNRTK